MYANTELVFTMFCFTPWPLQRYHLYKTFSVRMFSCSFGPYPALMKHPILDTLLLHSYIFDSLLSIFMKVNARINICVSLFLKPSFC